MAGNGAGQGDNPLEALALHGLVIQGSNGTSDTSQQSSAKERSKVCVCFLIMCV